MIGMNQTQCSSKKENVHLHYDEQWEGYSGADVVKRIENLAPVLDALISELTLKSQNRILDLGSGPGIIPIRLAHVFKTDYEINICGIEISEKAVQLGNKVIKEKDLNNSINLVRGDVENLPFIDEGYDAVISNATLNLLPDKKKSFYEMARVTKNKGQIIIGDCIAKIGETCKESEDNDRLWSQCVAGAPTKTEFKQYANEAGLTILEIKDLTKEVASLVKNRLWDWPEFIEHDLDYYIVKMIKS